MGDVWYFPSEGTRLDAVMDLIHTNHTVPSNIRKLVANSLDKLKEDFREHGTVLDETLDNLKFPPGYEEISMKKVNEGKIYVARDKRALCSQRAVWLNRKAVLLKQKALRRRLLQKIEQINKNRKKGLL